MFLEDTCAVMCCRSFPVALSELKNRCSSLPVHLSYSVSVSLTSSATSTASAVASPVASAVVSAVRPTSSSVCASNSISARRHGLVRW